VCGLIRNCNSLIGWGFPMPVPKQAPLRVQKSKTGARTPCGANTHFPHSLPVTEGVKASSPEACDCAETCGPSDYLKNASPKVTTCQSHVFNL
jgi:hypothetical protein